MRSFFNHSVSDLVEVVKHQLLVSKSDNKKTVSNHLIMHSYSHSALVKPVWLVGGFAASSYLLQALRDALNTKGTEGVTVQSPDTNVLVYYILASLFHLTAEY